MTGFDLDTAFFTSRGFAYLVVNYRGSTGYGRSYMTALRKRWGDADTMDAAEGAFAMVARGLADPGKLIIKGGSAGGYTVLNALERYPGLFKAGILLVWCFEPVHPGNGYPQIRSPLQRLTGW